MVESTTSIAKGTSRGNKLYYNESTDLISGHTAVGTLHDLVYKVSQVRKSVKQ